MTPSFAPNTTVFTSLTLLALLAGSTTAVATEPTAPSTSASPAPSEPAPSASAEPLPSDTDATVPPSEAPVRTAPPLQDSETSIDEALTPQDYISDPALLAELIGRNGAEMGQGLERLKVTGDPQVASPDEFLQSPPGAGAAPDAAPLAEAAPAATNYWKPSSGVLGVDVSSHQGQNVNWNGAWNYGSRFAYVKATEALSYKNPYFGTQYSGSYNQGMIRGAYHFAIPSVSSGAAQANYFVANGGGWSADGKTLPPLLDVEYNPYPELGNTCYNMSASQMVNWMRDFSNRMVTLTGRKPMIYTTTDWWSRCTGNSSAFGDHALHVASYNNVGAGQLPSSWSYYSVWQYTSSGPVIGDWNQWNGSLSSLQAFARGSNTGSGGAINQAWLRSGGYNGPLGAPKSSGDICNLHGGGCYQSFTGGNIYWTAATGAHPVTGAYWKAWGEAGWQMKIGYPTAGVRCGLHNGGCYQSFTGGNVYSHPSGGTHAVTGAYWKAWGEAGWQMKIGYPTTGVRCGLHNGGCYQSFTGGNVYSHPSGGTHAVTGAYWKAWGEAGWQMKIGYPTAGVRCGLHNGGCYQSFTGGNVYSHPSGGTHAVTGAYWKAWGEAGWQIGTLGYPKSPERCGLPDNGCQQDFVGGQIYYTQESGSNAVTEPYLASWQQAGFQGGALGYPLDPAVASLGYKRVEFQGGWLVYAASGVKVEYK